MTFETKLDAASVESSAARPLIHSVQDETGKSGAMSILSNIRDFHAQNPVQALATDAVLVGGLLLVATPMGRRLGVEALTKVGGVGKSLTHAGDDLAAKMLGTDRLAFQPALARGSSDFVGRTSASLDDLMSGPLLTDAGGRSAMRRRARAGRSYSSYRPSESPGSSGEPESWVKTALKAGTVALAAYGVKELIWG